MTLTHGEEYLEILKKLLKDAKYGDLFKPDLTPKEIEAIEWAINKIEY